MKIAGIDIGGANLKFALLDSPTPPFKTLNLNSVFTEHVEIADEFSFPFWTDHRELVSKLSEIREAIGNVDGVAITMTAELADCFENKRHGVHFIVDAVELAFRKTACRFYTTTGEMVNAELAKDNWALTAASNWHASAWFLFRHHQLQDGFLVDIGSTTCDIIPVQAGQPVSPGQTDLDRLRNRQLVYAGIGRTAVCSLIDSVRFPDYDVPVARELFATVADAMIWTNRTPPQPDCHDSADRRPLTRSACRTRLCRMLCADDHDLEDHQVTLLAEQTYAALKNQIAAGLRAVVAEHPSITKTFCLAGSGQALARSSIELACANQASQKIKTLATPSLKKDGQEKYRAGCPCDCGRGPMACNVGGCLVVPIRVIKIGGSLLRRDTLQADVQCWQRPPVEPLINVWITGGGEAVDAIRQRDRTHGLAAADAHWSSIEAMDANAMMFASQLPDWTLTSNPEDLLQAADSRLLDSRLSLREKNVTFAEREATMPTQNFILQTHQWLKTADRNLESHPRLPHSWDVTSDSIAAWAAIQLRATELVLLKSCDVPIASVPELARLGIIDAFLPTLTPLLSTRSFTCQQLPRSCS